MKKYLLLLVLIVLSSFALAVQVNPGSYFVPSESNYSYDFAQTMYATNITVDSLCMNVTGGEWNGDYCNVSATPTNYTFNSSPVLTVFDNANATFPEVGDNITLSVNVTDNYGIANATLEVNDNSTWQTVTTLPGANGTSEQFNADWEVRDENLNVSYRWTVYDTTNNSRTESSWFLVVDITDPVITINPNNGYSTNNDTVLSSLLYNLTYNVTFTDVNLSSYNISSDCSIDGNIYSSNNVAGSNNETATGTIDLTGLVPQTCSVTLTATDSAGNSVSQTNNYYVGTVLYIDSNNIYDDSEINNFNLTVSYISGNLSQTVEQTFNGSGQVENVTAGTFNLLFEQLDNYFFNSTLNITIANQSQNYTYNQSQSWFRIRLRDVATGQILSSYNATYYADNITNTNFSGTIHDPNGFTNPGNAFDDNFNTYAYKDGYTIAGTANSYLGKNFTVPEDVLTAQIKFGVEANWTVTGTSNIVDVRTITLQKFNGTDWVDFQQLFTQSKSGMYSSSFSYINISTVNVTIDESVEALRVKYFRNFNVLSGGPYSLDAAEDRLYELQFFEAPKPPIDDDPYKIFKLDANNYTIDFVPGGSYLNFSYPLEANYLENQTLTVDVSYGVIFNLIDEATLGAFNISSADEVKVVQNCPDQTVQTIINTTNPLVNVTCAYENIRFVLTYGDTNYYRTILTPVDELIDQFNISVYLINLDTTTPVFSSFIIDDLLNEYNGESIWVTRDIGNTTAQITADYVDIENKIGAYLIENAEYIITVKSSNQPDLVIGNYFAVTGEDKVLRLYDINLINALPEEGSSQIITISEQDNDTFVMATYNDTTNLTSNVTFYVWENNTNTTPVFTSTSTSAVVNFMYNATSSGNRTLIAGFDVVYTDNTTDSTASVLQVYEELKFELLSFVNSGTMNWFITLFVGMLALMATIPTGNKTSLILIGFSAVFIIFGLYTLSWGVLGLALLVALISNVKDGDIRV